MAEMAEFVLRKRKSKGKVAKSIPNSIVYAEPLNKQFLLLN